MKNYKNNLKLIENKIKKKRVVVVYGGFSEERETSLESGEAVFQELKKNGFNTIKIDPKLKDITKIIDGKNDIIFNCLHGSFGESGHLPAILDYMKVPYTFSGVYASAITMDKVFFKAVLKKMNIPCLEDNFDKNNKIIGKLIHKKIRGGSSLGMLVNKKKNKNKEYFSERFVMGKPITVGVLEKNGKFESLGVVEIKIKKDIFYSEKVKFGGLSEYQMYTGNYGDIIKNYAIKISEIIGIKGCARVDFIEYKNKIYLLELNSVPGMHSESNLVYSAKLVGLSFYELILRILDGAYFEEIK